MKENPIEIYGKKKNILFDKIIIKADCKKNFHRIFNEFFTVKKNRKSIFHKEICYKFNHK